MPYERQSYEQRRQPLDLLKTTAKKSWARRASENNPLAVGFSASLIIEFGGIMRVKPIQFSDLKAAQSNQKSSYRQGGPESSTEALEDPICIGRVS
jgi:hypothetical protein